ncbi:MAG: VWA domain-containing protein, partial [Gammaproteobacteria bacterium]|nr:VWA domain-containing protein [Gammaproteobacteria bacterium]
MLQVKLPMNEITNNARFILEQLHFIRADWFYAFIPLILFLILASTKKLNDKNWTSVIDPQLMPFVLSRSNSVKQRRYPLTLAFIASSLCITALAGPVYKKLPQPVYREQSSLVVLLDLSQSMDATDIKPSRLARAKLELLDILKARKTGQTALIVYAADAFVVTPLTDDNTTIANLVPSLETDMMPAQGSQLSTALSKTLSLFAQAGVIHGDILVITDDIHPRDESAILKIASQGHRLSIFGIGTAEGGPVPVDGGFLKDSNGAIVIAKLDAARLQRYALAGGGLYTGIRAGDGDVEKLSRLFQSSSIEQHTDNKQLDADIWQEEGYWLLLPLLFFAALWSRRGWLAVILPFALPCLLVFSALQPQPGYAAETTDNAATAPLIDTQNLWFSPDQKAMKAFQHGDNETAARQFTDPEWKASAYYRNGNYEAAAKALESSEQNDVYYNKANALAKLGRYEEAIKAYDKAIELDNNNEDAKYNRAQVKQALRNQQEEQQQNQQQSKDQNSEDKNSEKDQQQNNKDFENQQPDDKKSADKNSQKQDSKKQDPDQQDSQQQDSQQQSSDQSQDKNHSSDPDKKNDQQAEEEKQLKQRDAAAEEKDQQEQQSQYEQQQKENEQNNDT